jgi:transposase
MPMTSPDRIELSPAQRRELTGALRSGRSEQRLAQRARIVLHAADGHSTAMIAATVGVGEDTVRKWRHRWCLSPGLASLGDAKRSGRRPVFTPVQVAGVKALACQPPEASGLPLSRWTCPVLASHAVSTGLCQSISASTVGRLLREDALKPWQYQSWIFISDPDFASKAQNVLDLYARQWDGELLTDNDFVISADEKPSIQARCVRPASE